MTPNGQEREEPTIDTLTEFVEKVKEERDSSEDEEVEVDLRKVVAKIMKIIDSLDDPITRHRISYALVALYGMDLG